MAQHAGEYVYIIKEREHWRMGEAVFKVGCTGDFHKRARAYPKGSLVIVTMRVQSARAAERALLDSLRAASHFFRARRDIGAEYFEVLPGGSGSSPVGELVQHFAAAVVRFACDDPGAPPAPPVPEAVKRERMEVDPSPAEAGGSRKRRRSEGGEVELDALNLVREYLGKHAVPAGARVASADLHMMFARWVPQAYPRRCRQVCGLDRFIACVRRVSGARCAPGTLDLVFD